MTTVEILRWDAIQLPNEPNARPLVWFKGTTELIDFFQKNDWSVYVKVQSSNSSYDQDILLPCQVKPAIGMNTFANTGDYTIILPVGWNGYPTDHGNLIVSGLKGDYVWTTVEIEPNNGVVTPLYWSPPLDSEVRAEQGHEDRECFTIPEENEIESFSMASITSAFQLSPIQVLLLILIIIFLAILIKRTLNKRT